jgi:thiamine biosynthesis lipoprotein
LLLALAAGQFTACNRFFMNGVSSGSEAVSGNSELFYLDTYIEMTVYASNKQDCDAALSAAEAVFRRVHDLTSRFDDGSDVHRINTPPGAERPVKVNAETFAIIKAAIEYCEQSGGAFDIGIGAASELWEFKKSAESGEPDVQDDAKPPDRALLSRAVSIGGYKKIVLREEDLAVDAPPGLIIDLGGIAKGYAVHTAAETLKAHGIKSAIINAGGNVYAVGSKPSKDGAGADGPAPWKIGIRHPRPTQDARLLAVVEVSDKSVVTSGDYERFFVYGGTRYHHILDPETGMPSAAAISVTIISKDSTLADYLSTAVFVLGPEKGLELVAGYPGAEALIVAPDMTIFTSPGFNGEIIG